MPATTKRFAYTGAIATKVLEAIINDFKLKSDYVILTVDLTPDYTNSKYTAVVTTAHITDNIPQPAVPAIREEFSVASQKNRDAAPPTPSCARENKVIVYAHWEFDAYNLQYHLKVSTSFDPNKWFSTHIYLNLPQDFQLDDEIKRTVRSQLYRRKVINATDVIEFEVQ
jgi:hypothetical protein